ncbi:hypothetical protein Taro_031050 [Colocasia esculenta]|uniref:Geranylgeranyl transferase type-2 subunit beta n=1 Tax=Colocasia esculenta TaxID=4460 RepID=A0A843VTL9_COLES|nr:hypothetical protein [Colocasia esculenta]
MHTVCRALRKRLFGLFPGWATPLSSSSRSPSPPQLSLSLSLPFSPSLDFSLLLGVAAAVGSLWRKESTSSFPFFLPFSALWRRRPPSPRGAAAAACLAVLLRRGFGGNIGHDPHVLYTLSAVQVLALLHKLDILNVEKVSNCIHVAGLQNEDGSFSGDEWGEIDTRFSYCAICCLSLLHHLDKINVDKAVDYIVSCKNLDGGFGCTPGAESHAGQIFCCVGTLAITGFIDHVDKDLLGWWLSERQVKSGGLNGRPEKLPDVGFTFNAYKLVFVLELNTRIKFVSGLLFLVGSL